jgi:hypothetical protein
VRKPLVKLSRLTTVTVLLALVLGGLASSNGATASPRTYKNCVELNRAFKFGVALKTNSKNLGAQAIFSPVVNASVYNRNKRLDADRDGIACEVIRPATSKPTIVPNADTSAPLSNRILSSYAASLNQSDYKIQFTLCPGITQQRANDLIEAYQRAMKFWAQFYSPTKPIQWVLMGESDYNCWLENVRKLEGSFSDERVWDAKTNIMGHCQISASSFCGYGTAVRPNGVFVQYNLVGSKFQGKSDPAVVHHEAVHLYQMSLQSENINTSRANTLPAWFVEGQANLFGPVISRDGKFSNYRNTEIDRLKRVIRNAASMTAMEWTKELARLDTDYEFVFKNELGYSLGWLVLERVYQDYSLNQMHALLVEINKGSDWSSALSKVLQISKDALYEKVGTYLAAEIN